MAPISLDGHHTPGMQQMVPAGPQSISLSVLIDFILQRTYHELSVLAELLPRKTDLERKIEIVQFASRTRQLFVRLLALVKWATSASKVDKCSAIMAFLDKQSMLFVETADMLARMSRETLVHARLPNFHLPCAVEVLTTGSYIRMPTCIREKIVPPEPISLQDKRTTLQRLNQIIQHRLVSCPDLPDSMKKLTIENGRVSFHVEHEFEASLTIPGDGATIPWRLLDVSFLVEDRETGEGKSLVHPLQVQYMHQLCQARIADHPKPLHDLYTVLHSFCQSLQLEVLHSQVIRLCRERLGDYIKIEEYEPGKIITLSYWRVLSNRNDPNESTPYKVTVDARDATKPLKVTHNPPLPPDESLAAAQAVRSAQLSMEKLLVHTVYIRSKQRLTRLKDEFQQLLGPLAECSVTGTPAVLLVPFLQPCLRSEQLSFSIDIPTGLILVHVPQYLDAPMVQAIQQAVNFETGKLEQLISELRMWINFKRCAKTIQHLPASICSNLVVDCPPDHPFNKVDNRRIIIRLAKHASTFVVVEMKENPTNACELEERYYLLVTKTKMVQPGVVSTSVSLLVPFDTFTVTHGPLTKVDCGDTSSDQLTIGKRKLGGACGSGSGADSASKRPRHPAYFIPSLAHVIALLDERMNFVALVEQLTAHDINHSGIQIEPSASNLTLTITSMSRVDGLSSETMHSLNTNLLSCTIRLQGKGARTWLVEYVFVNCPVTSICPKEQSCRRMVYFQYEMLPAEKTVKTVEDMVADWEGLARLYQEVVNYANHLAKASEQPAGQAEIKSYTYRKLVVGYGPNRTYTFSLSWRSSEFCLQFAVLGESTSAANPHGIIAQQLQQEFNLHPGVAGLMLTINQTHSILLSVQKLNSLPLMGTIHSRPQVPVQDFTVLPQSSTHYRIAYRNIYCIDVHCRAGDIVAIRDGAYGLFDKVKLIEEFSPTQGLKAFLNKFVDDTLQIRRRPNNEDDNPPSPVVVGDGGGSSGPTNLLPGLDPFSMHLNNTLSPARETAPGLRFHRPHTPPSNPHTPASPHPGGSVLPPPSFGHSPAGVSFPLPSPPPMQGAGPSPAGLMVGSPSPGGFLATQSPGHMHSPSIMGQQSHMDTSSGSPFPAQSSMSMTSPATWPPSPLSRPSPAGAPRSLSAQSPGQPHIQQSLAMQSNAVMNSRILPQRSWAGAVPTILTVEAWEKLCTPTLLPGMPQLPASCPLERFLGCVYMKKHLQRFLQTEERLMPMVIPDPGVIGFRTESLHCKVALNNTFFQSLHIKIMSLPDLKVKWTLEELTILERYFEIRVACGPYKPNALLAFLRLLASPPHILTDIAQLLKQEIMPDRNLKWGIQWCLTIPPPAPPIAPIGTAAVMLTKDKLLFFIQLTRQIPDQPPVSLVLPIVYVMNNNVTQLADRRDVTLLPPTSPTLIVMNALKRFADFQRPSECSLFPAIKDLMTSLILPM